MPLNTQITQLQPQYAPCTAAGTSVYTSIQLPKLLKYMHQCYFIPCPSTWLKVIANNQFATWPRFTTKNMSKYLPASVATAKVHIDRVRKNLC